jgi:hypothetical protein
MQGDTTPAGEKWLAWIIRLLAEIPQIPAKAGTPTPEPAWILPGWIW